MGQLIHSILPNPPRAILHVSPKDTVKKCIKIMTDKNIGALVIIDSKNKPAGVITERDIIQSCLNQGFDLETTKVGDIACKEVSILNPHDFVETAMQVITETKRRYVLIYENNKLIAILSIGDLLLNILEDKARVIEHLEHYIYT